MNISSRLFYEYANYRYYREKLDSRLYEGKNIRTSEYQEWNHSSKWHFNLHCVSALPIGKYVAPRSPYPRSLAQICRRGIYLIFYRQDITGMSFSARNSLTKRKWRPNEDHVEAIERPVNGSTSASSSSVAPPSSGYLPRWNHSFVFLHDRPTEEDARKTEKKNDRTIDSLLSFFGKERRETESNKYIYIYI